MSVDEKVIGALRMMSAGGRGLVHGYERMIRALDMLRDVEDFDNDEVRAHVRSLSENIGGIKTLIQMTEAAIERLEKK